MCMIHVFHVYIFPVIANRVYVRGALMVSYDALHSLSTFWGTQVQAFVIEMY